MKPSGSGATLALLGLLVFFPASLSAISVFDVVRLTQEKYSDREIIKIIQLTDSRFVLKAEDTARLKKEGVPETVIREMLSRPASEKTAAQTAPPAGKPSRSSTAARDSAKNAPAEVPVQRLEPAAVLDEIVRLTKAGLSDETVLAYAKAHRAELPAVLPNDRLNYLRDSGVSRNVILYLTAIDVRASGEGSPEGAVYMSDEAEDQAQAVPQPTNPPPDYGQEPPAQEPGYDEGETYAVEPGYSGLSGYPASDYLSYYGDAYWGYPYYGGYYYPWWPSYFFVDVSGFFGRHHHGHGGHGHGDGHHGGHGDGHRGGSGGWGGRGGRGGGDFTTGQTWRDRPTMASGSYTQTSRQPRTSLAPRGSQGRSMVPSQSFDSASRGSSGGPRVVNRPGFSGGGSASAMSRGPVGRAGGRPGVVSRPGFSSGTGGGGGRGPIARSGGSFGGGRSGGFSGGGTRSGGFSGGGGRSGGGGGRGGGRGR